MSNEYEFRVPGADSPDFLGILKSLESMKAALLRVQSAAKKGVMPAAQDIEALADTLVFFATDNDKEAAREKITGYSLNQYIEAVTSLMPAAQQSEPA
jgi:hypothetical protein